MRKSEIIVERYYEDVFRFLRGLSGNEDLAKELTQETFCRAIKSIHTYRGESDFRVWLCSIAKHLFYDYCEKQKKTVLHTEYVEDIYSAREQSMFVQRLEDRETMLLLHQILHGLREPYKEVFSLRIFGELSFREIGELFGKSEHWACVTYHRARKMMQKEWKGAGYEDGM